MYNNVEEKLKVFAKVLYWVLFAISAVIFIYKFIALREFWIGLLYFALGILAARVLSLLLYGVGETLEISKENKRRIEKLEDMVCNSNVQSSKIQGGSSTFAKSANYSDHHNMVVCSQCGKKRAANLTKCPYCGNEE